MDKNTPKKKTAPKKMEKPKKISQILLALAASVLFVMMSALGVMGYLNLRSSHERMMALDRELVELRSAMNTDSVRQHKLQKIMRIIREHNPDLSSMEVYDMASEIFEMDVRYSNLDIDLICAVITHESANSWNPSIESPAGAIGLMQIMPVTGVFLAEYEGITWSGPEDILTNPVYNIRLGTRLLSALIERYGLDGALAAYNAGERHAAVWLANGKDENLLWRETREYIPAVRKLYDRYQARSL